MKNLTIAVALGLSAILFAACDRPADRSASTDRGNPSPAPEDGKALRASLDRYLGDLVEKRGLPGIAVAVVRDGRTIYAGAGGVRTLGDREALTPRHNFHFASVSKTFVATAIMQLVERGKLKLDDRVADVVPYFRLADQRYQDITIRQMLNHTSGMPAGDSNYEWDRPQFDEEAAERYVRAMASQNLLWAPGAGWQYSDLAFDALAHVIAKVSGQSFESYVMTNIFEPIGMAASSFIYPEIDPAFRTSGHVGNPARVSSVYPYNRRHAGSSTLNSNVIDMTRWMLVNLHRGELDGRRILQPASYDTLWRTTVRITPTGISPPVHIGLSWWISDLGGRRTIFHPGGDVGFRSLVFLVPGDRIGIALASNWQETPVETLVEEILDLVLASGRATAKESGK